MRTALWLRSIAVAGALVSTIAFSQTADKLRLVQNIPLGHVKGRIDHMEVDAGGKRLFVAGLENGSVEVVDLAVNKWARSVPGFKKPQGIAYIASLNKLFVASGDDAMVRVFRGDSLELLDSIKLEAGANRVTYDPLSELLYVGYGGKDAGKDYGEVGVIDAETDRHIADIRVSAHPGELLLDGSGHTLYVFIPGGKKIEVVDTRSRRVTDAWAVSSEQPGDGSFDERIHRLFVGTHVPPRMIAIDSQSGIEVASLATPEGMDGVYFDAGRKRIYVSGGRWSDTGHVYVYQQFDRDHYEIVEKIPTRAGAGTSFWSPELDRYYVAAPAFEKDEAAILVFAPQP